METNYRDKLKGLIEKGVIDSDLPSARTKIWFPDVSPGVTNQELDNAEWSQELFDYVLSQDSDPYCLPWGASYYNPEDKKIYPLYFNRSTGELQK